MNTASTVRCASPAAGRVARITMAVACMLMSALVMADDTGSVDVADASVTRAGDGYRLDTRFRIELSKGAREALDNGVPLVFELQVQLVRMHPWLWDSVEEETVVRRQLQYHALSRNYLVRNTATGVYGSYTKLEDALQATGLLENVALVNDLRNERRDYRVRLRGSLDIEALPTPVRLLAYVSSKWDIVSEWYSWPLPR